MGGRQVGRVFALVPSLFSGYLRCDLRCVVSPLRGDRLWYSLLSLNSAMQTVGLRWCSLPRLVSGAGTLFF